MAYSRGIQEVGESIQQTAIREIKEELDLDLNTGPLIGVYSDPKWNLTYPDGSNVQLLIFFFLMEGDISSISIQSSEITDFQFFSLGEIPDETMDCCKQKSC